MGQLIGFATEFYTLWDVEITPRYTTDAYGKHWHVGNDNAYHYIKNISNDLDKVKALFPQTPIDEGLRGKTRSFSAYSQLPNPCPHILGFGKYRGQDVNELVKTDLPYCLWLLENANDSALRQVVASLPQVLEMKAKQESEVDSFLATIPTIKESGLVELTVTSNAIAGEDGDFVRATLGEGSEIILMVDEVKLFGGNYRYPDYYLPVIGGKAKRLKDKTVKVNLALLETTQIRNFQPRVQQVAKLISLV